MPVAQLAHNDKESDTTKYTPFFVNYGKNPNLFREPLPGPEAQKAIIEVEGMKDLHNKLIINIGQTQDRMKKYKDRKIKMAPQLKKGDKVYLLTRNLKIKRPAKKLDGVKVGPFLIDEVKGPVNYKLQLPRDAKIHLIFHVSLLELADPDTPLQDQFHYEPEGEDEFEIEQILDYKNNKYLIKWVGYLSSENTWEPASGIKHCWLLVDQFHQQHPEKPRRRRPPPRTPTEK